MKKNLHSRKPLILYSWLGYQRETRSRVNSYKTSMNKNEKKLQVLIQSSYPKIVEAWCFKFGKKVQRRSFYQKKKQKKSC